MGKWQQTPSQLVRSPVCDGPKVMGEPCLFRSWGWRLSQTSGTCSTILSGHQAGQWVAFAVGPVIFEEKQWIPLCPVCWAMMFIRPRVSDVFSASNGMGLLRHKHLRSIWEVWVNCRPGSWPGIWPQKLSSYHYRRTAARKIGNRGWVGNNKTCPRAILHSHFADRIVYPAQPGLGVHSGGSWRRREASCWTKPNASIVTSNMDYFLKARRTIE